MSIPVSPVPFIEILMDEAHRDRGVLLERREALTQSGIDPDHLPDDLALMAFALLGDHDRERLVGELRGDWTGLQSRGLAQGAIEGVATAELRLLAHALAVIDAIGSLWEQLREPGEAPRPPAEVWHGATRIRGLWGEWARLHFSLRDVRHLLIDFDPVFGLQPALLATHPDSGYAGRVGFPIDNGTITLSLLHRSGRVFRQRIEVGIEEG